MARLKGLHSVLRQVPEKIQQMETKLGDNVSKRVSLTDLDRACENYDQLAIHEKEGVESP